MRHQHFVVAAALACAGAVACSSAMPSHSPSAAAPAAPFMKSVVSVKEFMRFTIDPLADNVFDAVTWDITKKGVVHVEPKTDEDWEKVKIGAVTLAEAIYLLKVPREMAPPGDVNNSTGENPPELSPAQIRQIATTCLWDAKIEAPGNAAKKHGDCREEDTKALFEASADLDMACEACHLEYWYPGDRAAVEDDARQRARFDKSAIAPKKKR
jgi:hypothetical protein